MSGVLLTLVPQSTMMLQRGGMIAPDGRCKTLDAAADGYVRGEACRTVYIAPAAALALHTHTAACPPWATPPQEALDSPRASSSSGVMVPEGIILGSGVNTNGRASALTAPHGPSQQALMQGVLRGAGREPGGVAALQLHANGTALGDPIEVGAASAVLLQVRRSCGQQYMRSVMYAMLAAVQRALQTTQQGFF